ncbi:MAG TPA: helix-turn-helix transcriptional regulator [Terriglobia bacterium]|nr:helix-turn-helix transcriptional regulator [Terriglobia bacterium]
MVFAMRLKELRTQTGLSLLDLASQSGLKPTYLSRIESEEEIPSYAVLEELSEALEVPLYRLFYDQHPPATPWLTRREGLEEYLSETTEPRPKSRVLNIIRFLYSEMISLLH